MRCVCVHIYTYKHAWFFYIYAHAWARLVRDLHMRVKQQIDIPFPHKIQRRRASFFQVQENKNKQKSTDGQYRTATNIVPSSSFLFSPGARNCHVWTSGHAQCGTVAKLSIVGHQHHLKKIYGQTKSLPMLQEEVNWIHQIIIVVSSTYLFVGRILVG